MYGNENTNNVFASIYMVPLSSLNYGLHFAGVGHICQTDSISGVFLGTQKEETAAH